MPKIWKSRSWHFVALFLRMDLTSHQLKPGPAKIKASDVPSRPTQTKLFQIRLSTERIQKNSTKKTFLPRPNSNHLPSDFCAFMDCFRLKASLRAAALISLDLASAPAEMLAMVAWFSDCSTEICCTTRWTYDYGPGTPGQGHFNPLESWENIQAIGRKNPPEMDRIFDIPRNFNAVKNGEKPSVHGQHHGSRLTKTKKSNRMTSPPPAVRTHSPP